MERNQSNDDLMELDELRERVVSWAQAHGIVVYPSRIYTPTAEAVWPTDLGLDAFLDFGRNVGATVIYLDLGRFNPQDLEANLADAIGVEEDKLEDRSEFDELAAMDPRLKAFEEKIAGHLGVHAIITVQWALGPVVHSFFQGAKWFIAIREEAAALADAGADVRTRKAQEDVESVKRKAEELANSQEFQSLSWPNQQTFVSTQCPNLSPQVQHQILNSARRLIEAVVIPQREREKVQRARKFIEEGHSLTAAAGKVDLTLNQLRRLLERYSRE